jgi:hypothetical protein
MTQRELARKPEVLLHHVQVGVAHSRAAYPDHNLAWTGRGLGHVLDLRLISVTHEPDCLHDELPFDRSR